VTADGPQKKKDGEFLPEPLGAGRVHVGPMAVRAAVKTDSKHGYSWNFTTPRFGSQLGDSRFSRD
jgi:hypothetical protein